MVFSDRLRNKRFTFQNLLEKTLTAAVLAYKALEHTSIDPLTIFFTASAATNRNEHVYLGSLIHSYNNSFLETVNMNEGNPV